MGQKNISLNRSLFFVDLNKRKDIKLKKINLITFFLSSAVLITSCSNQTNVPPKVNNLINKYYDGYLSNDSNMIVSVLSNNYESIGYPTKEDKRNGTSEIDFIKLIHISHSEMSIKEKVMESYITKDGYKVFVTGVEYYKHNETGNVIDVRFSDIWRINKSDKIVSRERFQNMMDYWADLDFGITKKVEVIFEVDMSNAKVEKGTGNEPAVYIVSGSNTGPSGVKMIKGKNNIWTGKVLMAPGKMNYKFRNGYYNDWGFQGWENGEIFLKDKCGFNQWGDREVIVQVSGDQRVGPFCFNSCKKCS